MSCTRGIAKKTTMVGVTWSVIRPARAAHSLGIGTGHCCPLRSGEINRKVALPCLSLCRHVTSSRPELGTLTLTQERPGSFARPSSEPEREMPGCRQLARSAGRCTHRCYDCLPAPNPSSGHVDLSVNDLKLSFSRFCPVNPAGMDGFHGSYHHHGRRSLGAACFD
jgi:hypothetical protein